MRDSLWCTSFSPFVRHWSTDCSVLEVRFLIKIQKNDIFQTIVNQYTFFAICSFFSFAFTISSDCLCIFFYFPEPLHQTTSSSSSPYLVFILSSPSSCSCFPCCSPHWNMTTQMNFWNLAAKIMLIIGNYREAEPTNGLLPSFVSSWSHCTYTSWQEGPECGRGELSC